MEAFRIYNPQGEHIDTVRADLLDTALTYYNAQRIVDIDGNPVGEYVATPCDAPKGWNA